MMDTVLKCFPKSFEDSNSTKPSDEFLKGTLAYNTNLWYIYNEQFSFAVPFFVVFLGLLCYYIFVPADYSPNAGTVGYILDYIDKAVPGRRDRKSHRKKTLEKLVEDIHRTCKVGNIPPVYPNGWFVLLESSDLRKEQAKNVSVLGENLTVFRKSDGTIQVQDASCPRCSKTGTEGETGGADCRLFSACRRKIDGAAKRETESVQVRTWRSCEVNHCVFVWYHAEGKEPTFELQPVKQVINGDWWLIGRSIHNNVRGHAQSDVNIDQTRDDWTWLERPPGCSSHIATGLFSYRLRLAGKFTIFSSTVTVTQVGPGYAELLVSSRFGKIMLINQGTPIEPLRHKIIARIYAPPILLLKARLFLTFSTDMFQRDVVMWEFKKHQDKPILVKEEELILRFRRYYNQFYSSNSIRYYE